MQVDKNIKGKHAVPIISAFWEAKAEGSLGATSLRPAWATWQDPTSTKNRNISWASWCPPVVLATCYLGTEAEGSLEPRRLRLQ